MFFWGLIEYICEPWLEVVQDQDVDLNIENDVHVLFTLFVSSPAPVEVPRRDESDPCSKPLNFYLGKFEPIFLIDKYFVANGCVPRMPNPQGDLHNKLFLCYSWRCSLCLCEHPFPSPDQYLDIPFLFPNKHHLCLTRIGHYCTVVYSRSNLHANVASSLI